MELKLTARQLDILRLTAQGLTTLQMAERLVVSPDTIETHFKEIYRRLGTNTRASAVYKTIQEGFLSLDLPVFRDIQA